jgi:hypothetical protein
MHENIEHRDPWFGHYWVHRWINGDAAKVPVYTSKFRAWRPTQQRARDGTIVRHKTGGLRKVA